MRPAAELCLCDGHVVLKEPNIGAGFAGSHAQARSGMRSLRPRGCLSLSAVALWRRALMP